MRSPFARYGILATLIIFWSGAAARGADEDLPPFDVAQWVSGPDRTDFPWNVTALKPRLTLQQRNLVPVLATIDFKRLPGPALQRDLHFVMKVANADGRWFSGFDYTHLRVPSRADRSQHQIEYATGLYLRPGRYTIALLVYDAVFKKGNVWRKQVKVPGLKRDPLPGLDRDLPDIEFISRVPSEAFDYNEPGGFHPYFIDSIWPLGQGRERLPVNNSRRLNIDIVVNISAGNSAFMRRSDYRMSSSHVLQVASVLSHLGLQNGSIRVSILDISRMKTIFDREGATGFDWQRASEVVAKQDQVTIDADLLRLQTQTSAYLFDELHKIEADGDRASETEPPLMVTILVSHQVLFVEHTPVKKVIPENPASTRFYYFCVMSSRSGDDLFEMLKPAKPRRFFTAEPRAFRKALADLISGLQESKR